MNIIRCQTAKGHIAHAALQSDGSALKLDGDIYGSPQVTSEKVIVAKLLAPIVPSSIICIGLNYRRHAAEAGAKHPEYPVVFFKGINTLQNPGDAIKFRRTCAVTKWTTNVNWRWSSGAPAKMFREKTRWRCAGLHLLQ